MTRCPRLAGALGLAAVLLGRAVLPCPGAAATISFREISQAWGLTFRHHSGAAGRHLLPETVGSGVALLDYDGDGDLDVLFVDSGSLAAQNGEEGSGSPHLFRNDGAAGGRQRFVEVTRSSRVDQARGYGMGVAAGDVDGDGDLDLYITAEGPNHLLINAGDGTFRDRTAEAGVSDPSWSTSAAFADVDRDGDLDLYVAGYLDYDLEHPRRCRDPVHDVEDYCHPELFAPLPDRFYRNRGDGTFEEATAAAGLAGSPGKGLGVAFADFDGDGWPDLYVANDTTPNAFFENRGDGTFEDSSLISGTAYGDRGVPEAGMGIAVGDADGDGRLDLVVTNFALETNALYHNTGKGLFLDGRFTAGLAAPSLVKLGFGVELADFDQDGRLDLAVANGHILDHVEVLGQPGVTYRQPNQVFRNRGGGRFEEVENSGLDVVRASRGLATGDLDGDGDLDLAINDSNDRCEVYENTGATGGWLEVDLDARSGNRFAVGALLELATAGEPSLHPVREVREVRTTSSYLSQSSLSAHFGLGSARRVDRLRITWPDGTVQEIRDLPADRRLRVVLP